MWRGGSAEYSGFALFRQFQRCYDNLPALHGHMGGDEQRDQDIRDVAGEERRRGRRPLNAKEQRTRRHLGEELFRAIRAGDERGFAEALRKAGYDDDSPEFARAWKLFRTR